MQIKISGITYQIVEKSHEEMGGRLGLADFNSQTISINGDYSSQTKMIAKWHETLHILSNAFNIGLQEEQVVVLTHALVALLQDNDLIVENFRSIKDE